MSPLEIVVFVLLWVSGSATLFVVQVFGDDKLNPEHEISAGILVFSIFGWILGDVLLIFAGLVLFFDFLLSIKIKTK